MSDWRKKARKFDEERVKCHSVAELVELAKRRKYKAPEVWARKVIEARQRKRFL